MKNKLSELENQLEEISENNKQIEAIASVLQDSWSDLMQTNKKDTTGLTTHHDMKRVAERNETLFYMLVELTMAVTKKNTTVLDAVTEIGWGAMKREGEDDGQE